MHKKSGQVTQWQILSLSVSNPEPAASSCGTPLFTWIRDFQVASYGHGGTCPSPWGCQCGSPGAGDRGAEAQVPCPLPPGPRFPILPAESDDDGSLHRGAPCQWPSTPAESGIGDSRGFFFCRVGDSRPRFPVTSGIGNGGFGPPSQARAQAPRLPWARPSDTEPQGQDWPGPL